jgi:hypothetical protein
VLAASLQEAMTERGLKAPAHIQESSFDFYFSYF